MRAGWRLGLGSCGHRGSRLAVGRLWGELAKKGLKTSPHDFIAEEDKVIALTTVSINDESDEAADILTYNKRGKLVAFDQLRDPAIANRAFPR